MSRRRALSTFRRALVVTLVAAIVLPALARADNFRATEGIPFVNEQLAVDTNCATNIANISVIWGDGSPSSPGSTGDATGSSTPILGSHTYTEEGTYSGTVSWTESSFDCGDSPDAGTAPPLAALSNIFTAVSSPATATCSGEGAITCTATFTATVDDAPLSAVPSSITPSGAQVTGTVASFADADPGGAIGDYSATIDWGDGSSSVGLVLAAPGGRFAIAGSHTYARAGSYSVVALVADQGGARGTASTTVTVAARPTSTAVLCSPATASIGQTTTCTATVTDTGGGATATPTGAVSFSSDGAGAFDSGTSCTLSGSGASASCSVSLKPSASGTQTITANYTGDAVHSSGGGSTPMTATAPALRATSTSVACSPGTVSPGQSTTCIATVADTGAGAPATPTGIVSFSSPDGAFGGGSTCRLSGSGASASCQVSFTPRQGTEATFTITASYGGQSGHIGGSAVTTVASTPVAGITAAVTVISGVVRITEGAAPGARAAAAASITPRKGATTAIAIGSTIDARKGVLRLVTAADYRTANDRRHRLQSGIFSAAMFAVKQQSAGHGLHKGVPRGKPPTDLVLANHPGAVKTARCRRKGAPGKGVVRSLNGIAKGLYRTVGAASTTTVTNATWSVQDRCDGTLTRVRRGRASISFKQRVRRHTVNRTVTITAGQSYLVRARFLEAKFLSATAARIATSLSAAVRR